MERERIIHRVQGLIALSLFVVVVLLAVKSREYVEEVGYTAHDRQSMERVTQKALRNAASAEQNQGTLIKLYGGEPDGSPITIYHRDGSAAR